ncbi:MAG: cation diffusion facilitator family transporter [Magnetospirillum sp. WYHS-4]
MRSAEPQNVAPPAPDAGQARLMRAATYASVGVATTLIAAKFSAWMMTDSVALLSTLIDSFLDVAASLVNLMAVHHSLQPADRDHRFGHGKAEPLAGLGQAAFIGGSGVFLLLQAGERLAHPRAVDNTTVGLAVMGLSILLTLVLVLFQKSVVKRTGSVAVAADSLHYQTDLLVNASVAVSLVLVAQFGWGVADPLFALAIVAYILHGAWKIGRDSLDHLMDREMPEADRLNIRELVVGHPGVIGMHDLRTRLAGMRAFVQLHLEMPGHLTLAEAHEIAEQVMYKIEAAYPNAEVLIHEDPQGVQERRVVFR